jgi:bifunctional N-acetylglucosamine-1-phosphate-uridyltransferase/glucosamine-1-phosphate-acetyltransferase GlmU-like protein
MNWLAEPLCKGADNSPYEYRHIGCWAGKRMKSALPKVLQTLAGKPLLHHVLDTALALQGKSSKTGPVVVVGHGATDVRGRA